MAFSVFITSAVFSYLHYDPEIYIYMVLKKVTIKIRIKSKRETNSLIFLVFRDKGLKPGSYCVFNPGMNAGVA